MKMFLIIVLAALVAVLGYYAVRFGMSVAIAKKQADRAVPYQKISDDLSLTMLVLGDSTAVGVGADTPEDTVAGRLSAALTATKVENYAKSGAVVADLPGQIEKAQLPAYHLILIQIGANDIINFRDAEKTASNLATMLDDLPEANEVILISAGNVGGATIFPPFVRGQYTARTLRFHDAFQRVATEHGVTYVNLYLPTEEDPFAKHPQIYLSPDGLHPSSEGYRLWFEKIWEQVRR